MAEHEKIETTSDRQPYDVPVLRRLGSVERLTLTGRGNGKEAGQNNKRSVL